MTHPSEVAVSAITVGELLMGAHGAQAPDREVEKVHGFLKPIPVLPYGTVEAGHYGRISASLRQQGQLIGVADAMIAATAEAHRRTVITKNFKHFQKVKDLKVVNWEAKAPKMLPSR
jgi:tRNA(fMet)-specific endonuclease VapC